MGPHIAKSGSCFLAGNTDRGLARVDAGPGAGRLLPPGAADHRGWREPCLRGRVYAPAPARGGGQAAASRAAIRPHKERSISARGRGPGPAAAPKRGATAGPGHRRGPAVCRVGAAAGRDLARASGAGRPAGGLRGGPPAAAGSGGASGAARSGGGAPGRPSGEPLSDEPRRPRAQVAGLRPVAADQPPAAGTRGGGARGVYLAGAVPRRGARDRRGQRSIRPGRGGPRDAVRPAPIPGRGRRGAAAAGLQRIVHPAQHPGGEPGTAGRRGALPRPASGQAAASPQHRDLRRRAARGPGPRAPIAPGTARAATARAGRACRGPHARRADGRAPAVPACRGGPPTQRAGC